MAGRLHSVKQTSVDRDWRHLSQDRSIIYFPRTLLLTPADEHCLYADLFFCCLYNICSASSASGRNSVQQRYHQRGHLRSDKRHASNTVCPSRAMIQRGVKGSCKGTVVAPAEIEHCTLCQYLGTGKNQDKVLSKHLLHGENWYQHFMHATYYLNTHVCFTFM